MTSDHEHTDIIGYLDHFQPPGRLVGWAVDRAAPGDPPLTIVVSLRGVELGRAVADGFRDDLVQFGSGHCSFTMELAGEIEAVDFMHNHLTVTAVNGEKGSKDLPMGPYVQHVATLLEAGRLLAELPQGPSLLLEIAAGEFWRHGSAPGRSAMTAIVTNLRNSFLSGPAILQGGADRLSPMLLPAGLVSSDGSTTLGRDGYLFIVGGTNDVAGLGRLDPASPMVQSTADKWHQLVASRCALSGERRFLQVIMPEKSSVLPELLDFDMAMPTPTLCEIEKRLGVSESDSAVCISARHVLSRSKASQVFRRIDSHLTPYGSFVVFREIMERLGLGSIELPSFSIEEVNTGDLAFRFLGREIYETISTAAGPDFVQSRRHVRHHFPEGGGHIGRFHVWENNDAPIRKRAVAFGNSFMDGDANQSSLSYWLAGWFQEFHFIFSPDMDLAYVERIDPDVVICQTIERFLLHVPGS